MNDQASIFPPKLSSPVEMFVNENYLDELQDTEFKRAITNFIKEFKEFEEDTNSSIKSRRKDVRGRNASMTLKKTQE